jgi:hypothetical protein
MALDSEIILNLPETERMTHGGRPALRGSVRFLSVRRLQVRLDELRQIFGARTSNSQFQHPAPGYVRYQRPPVEPIEPLILDSGERLQGQIKYYIMALSVFELPFSGDWDTAKWARWVWDVDFEARVTSYARSWNAQPRLWSSPIRNG